MRSVIPTLFVILLYAFSNMAFAVDKQITLDLEVVHIEYVKLVGTVVGATRSFDVSEVMPLGNSKTGPTVSLGMLGIESNIAGNCTLDFASADGKFRLMHTVSLKKLLTRYSLYYDGKEINSKNTSMVLPSCDIPLSSLDFVATGNFAKKREAGFYSDTVTITVTTE